MATIFPRLHLQSDLAASIAGTVAYSQDQEMLEHSSQHTLLAVLTKISTAISGMRLPHWGQLSDRLLAEQDNIYWQDSGLLSAMAST